MVLFPLISFYNVPQSNGTTGATAFFVILPLSEQIQLECAFPQGITDVEWLNGSTPHVETLPPQRNNTAVISLGVNADTHGHTFTCRGLDQSGQAVYKQYKVIARGTYKLEFHQEVKIPFKFAAIMF